MMLYGLTSAWVYPRIKSTELVQIYLIMLRVIMAMTDIKLTTRY